MGTLKELKWDVLLSSLLYVLLGIVLIFFPDTAVRSMGHFIGVISILAGAVSMICYLLRDAHENYGRNDFLYGLVGIAVGCFIFYKVELIVSLVPFILGLLVIVSGCGKLQDVIDMKRMNYGNWAAVLIIASINVLFGVVLLANPFKAATMLFRLIGAGLAFSGITDIFITFFFASKIKKYKKDMEVLDNSSFEEIKDE